MYTVKLNGYCYLHINMIIYLLLSCRTQCMCHPSPVIRYCTDVVSSCIRLITSEIDHAKIILI